jgi:plasmid stability protein
MPALVIKSFPEELHVRLKQIAATHRRSVTQETIHLLEKALLDEENSASPVSEVSSKWANRNLLPEYVAMEQSGAFRGGTDTSIALSEERDAK